MLQLPPRRATPCVISRHVFTHELMESFKVFDIYSYGPLCRQLNILFVEWIGFRASHVLSHPAEHVRVHRFVNARINGQRDHTERDAMSHTDI